MPTLVQLLQGRYRYVTSYGDATSRQDVYANTLIGNERSSLQPIDSGIKKVFTSKQSAVGVSKTEIYGLNGTVYIESRGIANPERLAALALSTPRAAADFIANQFSKYIGGTAKRPDDTIFAGPGLLNKPITLTRQTQALLRTGVQANQSYYVKQAPVPQQDIVKPIINAFKDDASLVTLGSLVLNKLISGPEYQKIKKALFSKRSTDKVYGGKFFKSGKIINKDKYTYSKYYREFAPALIPEGEKESDTRRQDQRRLDQNSLKLRTQTRMLDGKSPFDEINYDILTKTGSFDQSVRGIEDKLYQRSTGYTYVSITIYGTDKTIILPGTLSGISEDMTPEISNFKYIGSPFNLYRYSGVERSLKFNLKLYAESSEQEKALRTNLNDLRKLVFPDERITTITNKAGNNTGTETTSTLNFSPNIIVLTIYGLYKQIKGIVDSLSISVEDGVSWASHDYISLDSDKSIPHPTVFDVSMGIKIIEKPIIDKASDGSSKYIFDGDYFTGYKPGLNSLEDPCEKESQANPVIAKSAGTPPASNVSPSNATPNVSSTGTQNITSRVASLGGF